MRFYKRAARSCASVVGSVSSLGVLAAGMSGDWLFRLLSASRGIVRGAGRSVSSWRSDAASDVRAVWDPAVLLLPGRSTLARTANRCYVMRYDASLIRWRLAVSSFGLKSWRSVKEHTRSAGPAVNTRRGRRPLIRARADGSIRIRLKLGVRNLPAAVVRVGVKSRAVPNIEVIYVERCNCA